MAEIAQRFGLDAAVLRCRGRAFVPEGAEGKGGRVLGRGYDHALAVVARIDGYSVSLGGKEVTVEAAAKLAVLSEDELAALGLRRKKGKK